MERGERGREKERAREGERGRERGREGGRERKREGKGGRAREIRVKGASFIIIIPYGFRGDCLILFLCVNGHVLWFRFQQLYSSGFRVYVTVSVF